MTFEEMKEAVEMEGEAYLEARKSELAEFCERRKAEESEDFIWTPNGLISINNFQFHEKGKIFLLRKANKKELGGLLADYLFGQYEVETKEIKIFLSVFKDIEHIPKTIFHEYLHKAIHDIVEGTFLKEEKIVRQLVMEE